MTFEKKCFIKPEDILSVRLRCVKCKAISTIPIDKISPGNLQQFLMRDCLYCQTPTGFGIDTSETAHFARFNLLLAGLKDLLKGRNLEYGFEIECGDARGDAS